MEVNNQDQDHLRLLSIFYYVWAGLQLLAGLFGLVFIGVGTFLVTNPAVIAKGNGPPPAWFGALFAGVGLFVVLSFASLAVLSFLTGRYLAQRRHHTFCIVISVLSCMSIPFGTLLGVFSILVLQRPTVKQLFSVAPTTPPMPSEETH